eukprot:scaffold287_cov337-Pavlova_lutheri.AAC.111
MKRDHRRGETKEQTTLRAACVLRSTNMEQDRLDVRIAHEQVFEEAIQALNESIPALHDVLCNQVGNEMEEVFQTLDATLDNSAKELERSSGKLELLQQTLEQFYEQIAGEMNGSKTHEKTKA